MLLGEHAVLHGEKALVAAVNRRITLTLIPRKDRKVKIFAHALGDFETDLDFRYGLKPKAFRFVLTALECYRSQFSTGFDLNIESEFSDKVGLGSSAAVTVGVIALLKKLFVQTFSLEAVHQETLKVILSVQTLGSGADVAASVYGGVIAYKTTPFFIQKMPYKPDVVLAYCGYKTPTVEVIKRVKQLEKRQPFLYQKLYRLMGECVEEGIAAITDRNWCRVGEIFNIYQGLQTAIDVSDETLNHMIAHLREVPTILGAKISGSGLGDCVVALGEAPKTIFDHSSEIHLIPARITRTGLMFHEGE